jgi:hypothetical protein
VDSRFKFCAFVAGGPARTFAHADCAFFKQDAALAEAEAFLSTFPIVKREEKARWDGRFRSRDLILGWMAALVAGATDAAIAG